MRVPTSSSKPTSASKQDNHRPGVSETSQLSKSSSGGRFQKISDRYVLGNEIGKGGFGTVFECQDTETGGTVAVKRISLRDNLTKDRLSAIESEVRLLKNLDHPNILKYKGTVRSKDHLHIILEYMENGSLAQNIQKFGTFSQSLVALYIRQVLQGLQYLHDQGVIHRDIKGANILTTKVGLVKLGDFGVATHASEKSNQVVGTPYWMAPEIIEMSGPTTACDIWSVGCTVLELLTGKPPYYDVPPMAALYRIVQDDHPPFPEGISPALQEFLLLCFKKEPLLRSKASDLLRHRWVNKSRGIEESKALIDDGFGMSSKSIASSSSKKPTSFVNRTKIPSEKITEKERQSWRKSVMNTIRMSEAERQKMLSELRSKRHKNDNQNNNLINGQSKKHDNAELKPTRDNQEVKLKDEISDSGSEDWDAFSEDDTNQFENSFASRVQNIRAMVGQEVDFVQEKSDGVKESTEISNAKKITENALGPGDNGTLANKVMLPKGVDIRPHELSSIFSGDANSLFRKSAVTEPKGVTGPMPREDKLCLFREDEDENCFDELGFDENTNVFVGNAGLNQTPDFAMELRRRMKKSVSGADKTESKTNTFSSHEEDEFVDPFSKDFDEEDDEKDFEEDANRSLAAMQSAKVQRLIGLLTPQQETATLLEACENLTEIFREHPEQRRTLLTHHGVIPIMEMLELSHCKEVLHAVLKVVIQIIDSDRVFQELLSLAGLIPIVSRFARPTVSRNIRLQAASLVKQFLKTSNVTLQMFIACGGLPVLVGLLIPCYLGGKNEGTPDIALACVAVEGIQRVFQLSSTSSGTIPKNDFCRLFAKSGLLKELIALMEHCHSFQGETECAKVGVKADQLIQQVADILLVFSHGDVVVKQQMADPVILEGMLKILKLQASSSWQDQQNAGSADAGSCLGLTLSFKTLLKCVKNLTMEPSTLESLEKAGAIPTLVPFFSFCSSNSNHTSVLNQSNRRLTHEHVPSDHPIQTQQAKEIQNLVMLAMFYLCRLNRSRQEQAAVAGIIPYLKEAIVTFSAVKTFALQILCDFAHTSRITRKQLWRNGIHDFYLDLLVSGEVFWQEKALVSLEAWLANSDSEVERALLRPQALKRFVSLFQTAQNTNFEHCVKVLYSMMLRSKKLSECIGHSGIFISILVDRLSFPKAEVRINLLKLLKRIGESHRDLEHLILEHNLYAVVTSLAREAQESHRVLVSEIAHQLLEEWQQALKF